MKLTVASSPHIRGNFRTNRIMMDVVIALLPAWGVGIWKFGVQALVCVLVSVASAVATEYLYSLVMKKRNTVVDCSAVVTGLLLALTLPATVPVWQVVIGNVFAILFVKVLCGGLGQNIFEQLNVQIEYIPVTDRIPCGFQKQIHLQRGRKHNLRRC